MIPIFEKAHQLDLTGTEEEILQYFESNLPASIYPSLNDLSASLYTSNATIVRFCQKLLFIPQTLPSFVFVKNWA